jgi:hypothetical protein
VKIALYSPQPRDKYDKEYDTMKIKEILNDNQLYEMWLLMTDAVWEALVDNYSANDVYEGYPVRRRMAVRPIRQVPIQRPPRNLIKKPILAPANPAKKPMVSKSQTTGLNPKIDSLKGFNYRLDNTNIFPEITDKEAEIQHKRWR